jgi:glyceraldehyde-3-phosphate dehydrogenase type II
VRLKFFTFFLVLLFPHFSFALAPKTQNLSSGSLSSIENTHVEAHADILRSLIPEVQKIGAELIVRTVVFPSGNKVDALAIESRQDIAQALKAKLGKSLAKTLKGLMIFPVNLQNPWIDFSVSTLRTSDHRAFDANVVRSVLKKNSQLIMIGMNKTDTRSFEDSLSELLVLALKEAKEEQKNTVSSPVLPSFVQVQESNISGELKIITFVPRLDTDLGRIMQLAQARGIPIKSLIEKAISAEIKKTDLPILGEAQTVSASPRVSPRTKKEPFSPELSPLSQLKIAKQQTITIEDPETHIYDDELEEIFSILTKESKLLRILVLRGTSAEKKLYEIQKNISKSEFRMLEMTSHSLLRGKKAYQAFLIQPKKRILHVGFGTIAGKVVPAFQICGFGRSQAISIFHTALKRPERVLYAFKEGYSIYMTDLFEKIEGQMVNVFKTNPERLKQFEGKLLDLLIDSYTAEARNSLLEKIPESQRTKASENIFKKSSFLGNKKARAVLKRQYKGLLSPALNAGKFDLVVDGTPEGQGAANKENLYHIAAQTNPNMAFIYQGGEKHNVAEASFNAITANFDAIKEVKHLRHVSCNTTGISTIVYPLLEAISTPMEIDNLAIRRGQDPGDLKGGKNSIEYISNYHHGPDLKTVLPNWMHEGLHINTDAAKSGSMTRFHIHLLSLRRADGKPLDKYEIQKKLALLSRVALVDFPNGQFDSSRLNEISSNLLPQALIQNTVPLGANHLLVPVVTVLETDDPSELIMVYSIPQESIVAAGNVNAAQVLLNLADQAASLAIVNDAMGIPPRVNAIESLLPVAGIHLSENNAPIKNALSKKAA